MEIEQTLAQMSDEDLAAAYKLARRALLVQQAQVFDRTGFRAFFELVNGVPLHREGLRWVDNLFNTYEGGNKKLLQECFRGSGKSTVMTLGFSLFYIGHHPHTTNIIIRATASKAEETTQEIAKRIEEDEVFKEVFPHIKPVDGQWSKESGYSVRRTDLNTTEWNNLCRETTRPMGATLRGYSYDSNALQGARANGLLIVDDIHVKENTRSPRQLEDVKSFVETQMKPLAVPGQTVEIWNFTPWTPNDAYARQKEKGIYTYSRSPVMEEVDADHPDAVLWPEKIEWPSTYSEELRGILDKTSFPFAQRYWRLAWPERWDIPAIAQAFKDVGTTAFAREYLLDLTAAQGQRLKKDWLHYWDTSRYPIDPTWPVIVGVDYASVADREKAGRRDYAAVSIGRAVPGGGLVLTGGYYGHFTKMESLKILQRIAEGYPTLQSIKVEAIGKGEEFYNDALLMKDNSGRVLPLSKIVSHGKTSKGERFELYMGPRFESSRIWVSDAVNEFLMEFEKEWLEYPNGEHDDVLDAVYMMMVAGEGFTPSTAERSFMRRNRARNPYASIGATFNG